MTYYDDADYNNHIGYEPDDMDYDNTTVTSSVNVSDNARARRKLLEDYKKSDKGYHCVKRKIELDEDTVKTVKIEYYHTNYTPGTRIRNAISGVKQNYYVGSSDEDLFFKVVVANGEGGSDSLILFYDGPNDYQRHQHCVLSDDIIEKWTRKSDAERYRRKELENRNKRYSMEVV